MSPNRFRSALWLVIGAGALNYSLRQNRPLFLVAFAGAVADSAWVVNHQAIDITAVLYPEAAVLALVGLAQSLRRRGSGCGLHHV